MTQTAATSVIFDIDDTLADFAGFKANGGSYFKGVMSGAFAPKAEMIKIFHEYVAAGIEPLIVTARPAIMREATESWVKTNIGEFPVYMSDSAKRAKDWDRKREIVEMLIEGRNIVKAFDDKAENLAVFAEYGIEGVLV